MAAIDVDDLLQKMAAAASGVLKKKWSTAKGYAQGEFKKIGDSLAFIAVEVAAGRMTQEQARLHIKLQRNASQQVLMMVEGLSILAAEEAINAALDVIRQTVNTALGFVLF